MTAPTPSPEEFACSVWELMEAKNSNGAGDLIRARDAALLAPLREEVERLTRERDEAVKLVPDLRECLGTAHARAERAEAENARLREALSDVCRIASTGEDVPRALLGACYGVAARALAEGGGNPSQKL